MGAIITVHFYKRARAPRAIAKKAAAGFSIDPALVNSRGVPADAVACTWTEELLLVNSRGVPTDAVACADAVVLVNWSGVPTDTVGLTVAGHEAAAEALLAAHSAKLGELPLFTAAWIQATRAASPQEVVVLAGADVEVAEEELEVEVPVAPHEAEALLAAHSAKFGASPLLTAA
jgi:hypothetical protein